MKYFLSFRERITSKQEKNSRREQKMLGAAVLDTCVQNKHSSYSYLRYMFENRKINFHQDSSSRGAMGLIAPNDLLPKISVIHSK